VQQENGTASIPQYSLGKIILLFAWPALWFMVLAYGLGPLFAPANKPVPSPIFFAVAFLGNGAELIVALILLRREGYRLSPGALRERIRLRWPTGWKRWGLALAVFVVAGTLSILANPMSKWLATVPGFIPPAFWPPISNPTAKVTGVADVFPDIHLAGNYLFFAVFLVYGLVFNAVGEELYYRGLLLPKMRGVFGKWDWVANGLLFTLKHIYQRWLFPSIAPGGLGFALVAGPLGSLPLAMLFHWSGNFLLAVLAMIPAVFGAR
jgi:membrane protease YdiL (CAAX protease family)